MHRFNFKCMNSSLLCRKARNASVPSRLCNIDGVGVNRVFDALRNAVSINAIGFKAPESMNSCTIVDIVFHIIISYQFINRIESIIYYCHLIYVKHTMVLS